MSNDVSDQGISGDVAAPQDRPKSESDPANAVPRVASEAADTSTGPAARQRRYRERHAIRVDYMPSAGVTSIIEQAVRENPQMPLGAVLDHLVAAGAQHFTACVRTSDRPAASAPTGVVDD